MYWGFWHCVLKDIKRGSVVHVGSSIVLCRPYPWLLRARELTLPRDPSQNNHRRGMVGLVRFEGVRLCH